MSEARAIQRTARQSPYKMRLVIDQVRGMNVNEALALLKFSKKHAAKQIEKVLKSAVANAEQASRNANEPLDVDALFVKKAIVNEGPKLKRFTPAAMGRATQVLKRTSHVEIIVSEREKRVRAARATPKSKATGKSPSTESAPKAAKPKASGKAKSPKATSKKEKA